MERIERIALGKAYELQRVLLEKGGSVTIADLIPYYIYIFTGRKVRKASIATPEKSTECTWNSGVNLYQNYRHIHCSNVLFHQNQDLRAFLSKYPILFKIENDLVHLIPREGDRDYDQEARVFFVHKLRSYRCGRRVSIANLLDQRHGHTSSRDIKYLPGKLMSHLHLELHWWWICVPLFV